MATAHDRRSTRQSESAGWRESRPFWGGLLLIVASLLIAWVPMQFAMELFLIGGAFTIVGLAFAVIVFLIGAFALMKPNLSTMLGVTGIAFSILSLIGALGGLLFGTILGIVGGSLCVAWQPPGTEEPEETLPQTAGTTTSPGAGGQFQWEQDQTAALGESTTSTQGTVLMEEEETMVSDMEPEETSVSDTGAAAEDSRFEWEEDRSETAGTETRAADEAEPDSGATDTDASPFGSDESADEDPTFSWEEDPYAEDKK